MSQLPRHASQQPLFTLGTEAQSCHPYTGTSAGRADVLGLAISIVSAVPEKVWFCTKKGYAPWERPKRQDMGTHEEGGHTIWYNEPELMQVRVIAVDHHASQTQTSHCALPLPAGPFKAGISWQ